MSFECWDCERDLRSSHDPSCSRYVRRECKWCGHLAEEHDEEGYCMAEDCRKCSFFEEV